ncbi:MAG: Mrp/NBP35 family ATP-binding protein [Bacteroidales bacterium]|nr:Mrp/NBP35 family ATP-binding protein [Bacteroidales bacterium]
MEIRKEDAFEALKGVLYFPKHDNVAALDMVRDIKVDGKKVSFALFFAERDEQNENTLRQACISAIVNNVDQDAEVDVEIRYPADPLAKVKNIVAVASGKGGVGKSTVAANLAIALSRQGFKTGIVDADIYGPSIPLMFDVVHAKPAVKNENGQQWIIPVEKYGIKVLSIGFFVDPSQALIWRGPMASNALKQLLGETEWGELDYLVIDLPPGTGDVQLTLAQDFKISGIAVVTTPQEVALADARKAISMFNQEQIRIPVLGLVENMSYFTPAELPDNKYYIFGREGGKTLAKKSGVPLLGEIPLVQGICDSGDKGAPIALDDDSPVTAAFMQLAKNIDKELKKIKNN